MSSAAPVQPQPSLLARYRQQARVLESRSFDELPLRPSGSPVEACEAQQQIWLHAQFANGVPLYNEVVTIHFRGDLDLAAFERAFNEVLRRHEAWRTAFEWRDSKLWQIITPELTVKIPLTDLRNTRAADRNRAAVDLVSRDATVPIDVSKTPLFRPRVVRLADREFRFYLCLHHLIFDGVSLYQVFFPELRDCYSAFVNGEQAALPPVAAQYADWCLYQQQAAHRETIAENMHYWERQLAGDLPEMPLPADRPRPAIRSFAGAMEPFFIPQDVAQKLKILGQQYNVTSFMTYLAAFHVLLYEWTGATDQVIGSVTSTRKHEETERALGFFLNTIVLRSELKSAESFPDLLTRVRGITLDALNYEVPFSSLVQRFGKRRKPGVSPLFQVMLSLQPPLPPLGDSWNLSHMDIETGASKFDLYLQLDERADGLLGRFTYSRELFDPPSMTALRVKWTSLLCAIADNPLQTVSQLLEGLKDVENQGTKAKEEGRPGWAKRVQASLLTLAGGRRRP